MCMCVCMHIEIENCINENCIFEVEDRKSNTEAARQLVALSLPSLPQGISGYRL